MVVRSLSRGMVASWLRRTVPGRVLPLVLSIRRLRTIAFRFISELDIRYRRSPIVVNGEPGLRRGPRAGDRLPDAPVVRDGRATWLHAEITGPYFHLLLCGPTASWDRAQLEGIAERYADLVVVIRLTRERVPGVLRDAAGAVLHQLGVSKAAQFLIRPDGHVGFRCGGTDLSGVVEYLRRWLIDPPMCV